MVNIMDCCLGGELLQYVKLKGRLSEEEAKTIFIQVIDAIDYCHKEYGIIHRDLKLENILLTEEGKLDIKVQEFLFKVFITNRLLILVLRGFIWEFIQYKTTQVPCSIYHLKL